MNNLVPVAQRVVGPQEGPQLRASMCGADVIVYGGAAGGGKTYWMLMEALRDINVPGYAAVIFRRTYPMIKNPGGLWDTSLGFYPDVGAKPKESVLEHVFPGGQVVKFAHMQHEKNKTDWQGAQIPFIGFDELTHFSKGQFFYMLSRNRSSSGVKGRILATCNPSSVSWVRELLGWWINKETGFPVPQRDGKTRWFMQDGDKLEWADDPDELMPLCDKLSKATGAKVRPKSLAFFAAKVTDNRALLARDPGYVSNLHALSLFERQQLLKGNWNVRPVAGMFFRREWFEVVRAAPSQGKTIRYWDRAATEPTEHTDPDWTVGTLMRRGEDGLFYVIDVERFRARPDGVRKRIRAVCSQDAANSTDYEVWLEEDPGQAGKSELQQLAGYLAQFSVFANRVTKSKVQRALPASAQSEAGNVKVVSADWNEEWFTELEGFCDEDQLPEELLLGAEKMKKDQVDSFSGAYNMLATTPDPGVY